MITLDKELSGQIICSIIYLQWSLVELNCLKAHEFLLVVALRYTVKWFTKWINRRWGTHMIYMHIDILSIYFSFHWFTFKIWCFWVPFFFLNVDKLGLHYCSIFIFFTCKVIMGCTFTWFIAICVFFFFLPLSSYLAIILHVKILKSTDRLKYGWIHLTRASS